MLDSAQTSQLSRHLYRVACLIGLLLVHAGLSAASETPAYRRYGPWVSGVLGGGGFLQQVVWAATDPQRMYVAGDVGGCFRSDDGGRHWRMLHGVLPAAAGNYEVRGLQVDPRDGDRLLMATSLGIWLSEDGGGSFRQVLQAPFDGNGPGRMHGRVLIADPTNPDVILAAPLGAGIQRSLDGGRTWTACGATGTWPTGLLCDRSDPRRLWMCARAPDAGDQVTGHRLDGAAGLWESGDGGVTWRLASDRQLHELLQDPIDPAVFYGLSANDQVVRSADRMRTWTRYATGLAASGGGPRDDGTYHAITVAGQDVLLAGHGAHFYRLDRASAAWVAVPWETVREGGWWGARERHGYQHFGSALGFLGVAPGNLRRWACTDWYGIYLSGDAGRSWDLAIDGIEMTVAHCVLQDQDDGGVVHLGLADVGYFRSVDGGDGWAGMRPGISNNIKCLAQSSASPERMWAVGPRTWEWHANHVYRSEDRGLTWQATSMRGLPDMAEARCNTVAVHPQRRDEVWIAVSGRVAPGSGGIWRSVDAGATWTWSGDGLPEAPALFRRDIWVSGPELAVSSDGSMVAAGNDDGRTFRRAQADARWEEITWPAGGGPNAVIADAMTPGRFLAARKEGGLWESRDGGATWTRILVRNAWSVAVDRRNPKLLAAYGADGGWLSGDAGATWRPLPDGLPYRHLRNLVAFSGGRLVVATGGNGAFYIPLAAIGGAAKAMTDRAVATRRSPP